jgi:hypothetical protein
LQTVYPDVVHSALDVHTFRTLLPIPDASTQDVEHTKNSPPMPPESQQIMSLGQSLCLAHLPTIQSLLSVPQAYGVLPMWHIWQTGVAEVSLHGTNTVLQVPFPSQSMLSTPVTHLVRAALLL